MSAGNRGQRLLRGWQSACSCREHDQVGTCRLLALSLLPFPNFPLLHVASLQADLSCPRGSSLSSATGASWAWGTRGVSP